MPSANRVILASAGSGKTTAIIDDACRDETRTAALVTYTINGSSEISQCVYERFRAVPPNVTVSTWYTFLLRHFVRPYQNYLYAPRVSRIHFVHGQSAQYTKANDVARHYFSQPGSIYLDKVSKFACEIIKRTDGLPIRRFEHIFDRLFVDESQDLAGFDLELIEHLLKSRTEVVMVGDHRQATYSTNDSRKNKQYARAKILEKFEEWKEAGLCAIEYATHSYRCVQPICDLADRFYPGFPRTKSLNPLISGHDGVFVIDESQVESYCARFNPQRLRYNRTYEVPGRPINFGNAKGMTFDRTLIYPHGPLKKFLGSGQITDAGNEIPKLYVAITRARQSVAFVFDGDTAIEGLRAYRP